MRTLLTFLLGVGFGLLLALLYAPQSGKKTRKKLQKRAKKLQLEVEAQTEKGFETMSEWKVSAEELVEDAAKRMNGKANDTVVI